MTAVHDEPGRRSRRVRQRFEHTVLGWGMAAVTMVLDRWVRRAVRRAAADG